MSRKDSINTCKAEKMIKGYYHYRNRKYILKDKLKRVEKRLEQLRKDLRECNIDLEVSIGGTDYSKEPIQSTPSTPSAIERELERAIDSIIREITRTIKEKYRLKARIADAEEKFDNIDVIINTLTEEDIRILELRYGGRKGIPVSYKRMENVLLVDASSIYSKHKDLLEYLEKQLK